MSRDHHHSNMNFGMGDHGKCGHSVENSKRRRALPPLPALAGAARFFDRVLNAPKTQEFVFITKAVAKNR